MITAAEIARFRKPAGSYGPTEQLKALLARSRQGRHPLYLTRDELEKIMEWKLGPRVGQQRHGRDRSPERIVRNVTCFALTMTYPQDPEYELELQTGVLCCLRGVDVQVASAVLGLVFPEKYAVLDYRVWRRLFGEDKWSFEIADYKRYMHELRLLADDLGWEVQEVDGAIWAYDARERMGRG